MKKHVWALLLSIPSLYTGTANATWSVFADALYWQLSQETTSVWASTITDVDNHLVFEANDVNFNAQWGFRLGLEYAPCPQLWDTSLVWTHYTPKSSSQVPLGSQLMLSEAFSGFISADFLFGGQLDWQFDMNMVDLAASHPMKIGKGLTLRPSVGLKAGTIRQQIDVNWNAIIFQATENISHHYKAFGPTIGLASDWAVHKDISLLANVNAAFLWGRWNVKDTFSRPDALDDLIFATTITTQMNNSQMSTLMFDYFLGVEWRMGVKFNPTLALGYEMQYWPNQVRLLSFQQLPLHGDLTLQGATCRIHFDL